MSKKSRKRNKRLLALAGLAGAVALSNRKAKAELAGTEDNKSASAESIPTGPKELGISTANKKTTTIRDNKPKVFKPNKSAVDGIMRGDSGTKYEDKYAGTPFRRIQKQSEGIDGVSDPMYAKDGGRAGLKSGGKVRGCGIAKRGLGRAMKKGKR